jgi:hypothetical protein
MHLFYAINQSNASMVVEVKTSLLDHRQNAMFVCFQQDGNLGIPIIETIAALK